MGLDLYSDEELKKELELRKNFVKKQPKPLDNPNYESIKGFAEEVVNEIVNGGYPNEDNPQYAFETIMEVVYGPNFFEWYNKVVD